MMESAHSSMPQSEDFDDPFAGLTDDASTFTSATETEIPENATTVDEEADPWALLAAAAGEEAPQPPPSTQQSDSGEQPSTSFAQGETFSMPPPTQSPEGLSLLTSVQTHASTLSRTLSTKLQQMDARHGISQKVSHVKSHVEERYHVTEKMNEFHTKVVKPAVVEKVVPTVKEGWGSLRSKVANLHSETDGAGIDSTDSEAWNKDIRQQWSSLSTALGCKWNATAAVLEKKAESWKEGHLQWRAEQRKMDISKRSPEKVSVVGTLMDMDSRDGIPSSFLKDL
jgi:hypothetical protein